MCSVDVRRGAILMALMSLTKDEKKRVEGEGEEKDDDAFETVRDDVQVSVCLEGRTE